MQEGGTGPFLPQETRDWDTGWIVADVITLLGAAARR